MRSNSETFLQKTLGEDFMESLAKTELWKPGTKSVIDIDDMRIGLKIVPRAILSFLVRELTSMNIGDNKSVAIPVNGDAVLNVTKHERDQFSGEIVHDNRKIVDFKLRSLPGVGLVIMSAFELYNPDELMDNPHQHQVGEDIEQKVQKMIDERMALHDLIERVVDKKLSQREAVSKLMLSKLTDGLKKRKPKEIEVPQLDKAIDMPETPPTPILGAGIKSEIVKAQKPLATFMAKKKKPKEFAIQLAKGEEVSCPDCRKNIFDGAVFSGCVCLGQDMDRKVFIKKSEDGIKVRFSKGWDQENIEMLLEVLQKKNK